MPGCHLCQKKGVGEECRLIARASKPVLNQIPSAGEGLATGPVQPPHTLLGDPDADDVLLLDAVPLERLNRQACIVCDALGLEARYRHCSQARISLDCLLTYRRWCSARLDSVASAPRQAEAPFSQPACACGPFPYPN